MLPIGDNMEHLMNILAGLSIILTLYVGMGILAKKPVKRTRRSAPIVTPYENVPNKTLIRGKN